MANFIAGNVFVLGSSPSQSGVEKCRSIIGFKNKILESTITGQAEDPLYPFTNCLDYRDNTQYSPSATSGSVTIEFRQTVATPMDYIGLAIHNGQAAGLSGTLEVFINNAWQLVTTFTPIAENATMCKYFDPVTSDRQRITLNFSSKLYIGAIYLGKAWVFPRMPNLGFTPGKTNSQDRVVGFSSESGQFIIGRRESRGHEQEFSFDFIAFEGANSFNQEYVNFMEHVKAGNKPFFMKWDVTRDENMFGQHTSPNNMQAPRYDNNTSGTFSGSMRGYP